MLCLHDAHLLNRAAHPVTLLFVSGSQFKWHSQTFSGVTSTQPELNKIKKKSTDPLISKHTYKTRVVTPNKQHGSWLLSVSHLVFISCFLFPDSVPTADEN